MKPVRFSRRVHNRYGRPHEHGEMTKVEVKYADELEILKRQDEIVTWWFERFKFKLAGGCFYTPDFGVFLLDGTIEFIDVKGTGPVDDKSIVKAKMAAELFFPFPFSILQEIPKKAGGGWKKRTF